MKTQSMDSEAARAAARRLYQKVNFGGGALQSYEISSLLTETYEYLKIRNTPIIQPSNLPQKTSNPILKCWTSIEMDRSLLEISKVWPLASYVDPAS